MPGAQRDKRGYSDGEQGIGDGPGLGENDDTGNYYTYRRADIAEDMESRCTHVQVTALSPQAETYEEIDNNTYTCREKHHQWLYRFGMLKALGCLEEDGQGNENQCYCIGQPAAHQFHNQDKDRQKKSQAQALFCHFMSMIMFITHNNTP